MEQFIQQIVGKLYIELEILQVKLAKIEKERDDALKLLTKQEK